MESNSIKPANKYEKETRVIWRSEINFAEYNPRVIDKDAKKKLSQNIAEVGLLGGIVWNQRSSRLVSGHQRIKDLDKKFKGEDYQITVTVVDLDENAEKEQNLFMNNPNAQGEFDFCKLGEMLQSGIDAVSAGFDPAQVHQMFGNSIDQQTPEDIKAMADHVRELESTVERVKAGNQDKNNQDFYLVVVFRSYEDRKEFTDKHGLEDNMYASGDKIRELIEPEGEE